MNGTPTAAAAGKIDVGGDLTVNRLGYGAMRITGPVAPIDLTAGLSAPLLGLFGNDDSHPSPAQVDLHEAELKRHGKDYEFHRYDGAGHAFFYYQAPIYRPEQAMDGWEKIFDFFGRKL